MATDEQIERVRVLSEDWDLSGEDTDALAAVLSELATLRELRDAVEEHEEAAKHDRLKESGFARHSAARRALDAAIAKCQWTNPSPLPRDDLTQLAEVG